MKEVFKIISRPKTSWTGMDFNVVWYVLCTTKALSDSIPDQGHTCLGNYFVIQVYVRVLLLLDIFAPVLSFLAYFLQLHIPG